MAIKHLSDKNFQTTIADNPLNSVAMGSGKFVEEFEVLQSLLISEPRH